MILKTSLFLAYILNSFLENLCEDLTIVDTLNDSPIDQVQ